MMTTNKAPINEIVTFLSKNDVVQLESLKSKFPEFIDLLDTGIILDEDEAIDIDSERKEYKFRIEVSQAFLKSSCSKGKILATKIKKRLQYLNNIQLISQIIVIISGATILTMIQKELDEYTWIKYIAPILVLLASILTIIAKNRSEPVIAGKENLYELSSNLITSVSEATFLLAELDIVRNHFSIEKAKVCIEQSNNLAQKVYLLIERAEI